MEVTVGDNFLASQAHLQYWMLCNSEFRIRFGDRLIYTTPLKGTFYYVLRYQKRIIVFVIVARTAWLIGFCTIHGFYQVQSKEIEDLFMDSSHTRILPFNGNHKSISPEGTGSTSINLDAIRRRFDVLYNYTGANSHPDTLGIASSLGFFVVFLMESKSKVILQRHHSSLVDFAYFKLGNDWVITAITNWSSISQQVMRFLDDINHRPHDCGIEHLKQSDQLLDVFYYLHVDGYFSGMFEHEPMDPEPRILVWDPVDNGVGDGDIVVPVEPASEDSRSIICHGRPKKRNNKKRRGLSGGGLGGSAAAPDVFLAWAQANDDTAVQKKKCDMLVSHLTIMGLTVLQAKQKLGSQKLKQLGKKAKGSSDSVEAKEKLAATPIPLAHLCEKVKKSAVLESNDERTPTPKLLEGLVKWLDTLSISVPSAEKHMSLIKSNKSLSPDDISSLKDGEFISDAIICVVLDNLMAYLGNKDIHDVQLLAPTVSFLMCQDPIVAASTAQALNLSLSRLVLLPVNDNDLNQEGGGKHWSLLVFDNWTLHGPRLMHYDSSGSFNFSHAYKLAGHIIPYLPDGTIDMVRGETPQQGNSYDCGIYLMAIAACICKWCEHASAAAAAAGVQDADWSGAMWREVTTESVASLRTWLRQTLQE